MKISIIGLGWFGLPLAQKLAESYEVKGSKSSLAGVESAAAMGVQAYQLLLDPEWSAAQTATDALLDAHTVVLNIPPAIRSGQSEDHYYLQMKSVLYQLNHSKVQHLIFISSTGVFGENQLESDEDTTPEPSRGAGRVLLLAEQLFSSAFNGRTSIIRPGGLVGAGRHPGRFLAGRKELSGSMHPVNLVHLDDLIALTSAIIENPPARKVFHAVAKSHPSKGIYYRKAAESLGLTPPEFDASDVSQGKVVAGEKSKRAAEVQFIYDDPYQMIG